MSRTNEALSRKRKADSFECAEPVPDEDLLLFIRLRCTYLRGWAGFSRTRITRAEESLIAPGLEKVATFSILSRYSLI
jgi:hypothetical protein